MKVILFFIILFSNIIVFSVLADDYKINSLSFPCLGCHGTMNNSSIPNILFYLYSSENITNIKKQLNDNNEDALLLNNITDNTNKYYFVKNTDNEYFHISNIKNILLKTLRTFNNDEYTNKIV